MTRFFAGATLVLAAATCATARAGHGYGQSDQPTQGLARVSAEGVLELRQVAVKQVHEARIATQTVTQYREETRQREVTQTENGKPVTRLETYIVKVPYQVEQPYTYTVAVPVAEVQSSDFRRDGDDYVRAVDGEPVVFYELDGKSAAADGVPRRLRQWTDVLLTRNGKPVPDYFAFLFKPGTLVIALPQPLPPAAHHEHPAPQAVPAPAPPPSTRNAAPAPNAPRTSASLRKSPGSAPIYTVAFQESDTADDEPKFPEGLPPDRQFAQVKDGTISLRTIEEHSWEGTGIRTRPVTEIVDGKPVTVEKQEPVTMRNTVRTNHILHVPVEAMTAQTADGKALSGRELAARLAKETTVVVSSDGKPVDPFWLRALQERTVVVVPPVFQGHGKPMPAPSAIQAQPVPVPAPAVVP